MPAAIQDVSSAGGSNKEVSLMKCLTKSFDE